MIKDWNFWVSIITAITAIIALFLSVGQMRLSNKQHLFDRRLDAYILIRGMVALYKEKRESLERKEWDQVEFAIDIDFLSLTNNTYLEQQIEAMSHPLEQPYHKEFLKKREELCRLATEIELIFKGKEAKIYANFIYSYADVLYKMYQYKIVINKIEEENTKCPTELDVLQKRFDEERYRNEIALAIKELNSKYKIIVNNDVDNKITPLYNFFKIKDAAQGTSMYNKFATINQQRSDLIRQIYYTTKKI